MHLKTILQPLADSHVVLNPYDDVSSVEHKLKYFEAYSHCIFPYYKHRNDHVESSYKHNKEKLVYVRSWVQLLRKCMN